MSPLSTLPAELHQEIATHLPPRARYALRLTSLRLYTNIPPPSHAENLTIERSLPLQIKNKYPRASAPTTAIPAPSAFPLLPNNYITYQYLACSACLRLRLPDDYIETQRGQTFDAVEPEERMCMECGIEKGEAGYGPGGLFRGAFNDATRAFCGGCVEFPREEGASLRRRVGECRGCFARRGVDVMEQVTTTVGGFCMELHHGVRCSRCAVRFSLC